MESPESVARAQRSVRPVGLGEHLVRANLHDGINCRVDLINSREMGLNDFARRDVARRE